MVQNMNRFNAVLIDIQKRAMVGTAWGVFDSIRK